MERQIDKVFLFLSANKITHFQNLFALEEIVSIKSYIYWRIGFTQITSFLSINCKDSY